MNQVAQESLVVNGHEVGSDGVVEGEYFGYESQFLGALLFCFPGAADGDYLLYKFFGIDQAVVIIEQRLETRSVGSCKNCRSDHRGSQTI